MTASVEQNILYCSLINALFACNNKRQLQFTECMGGLVGLDILFVATCSFIFQVRLLFGKLEIPTSKALTPF